MPENQSQLLAGAASQLEVPLTEKQLQLFTRYAQEIMAWNEKINLLSRSSATDTLLKNFLDALAIINFLPHRGSTVLDMGSGGGFPGIPMKIAVETLKMSLLEASRKKSSFLKHAIRVLALREITVLHDRAENLLQDDDYRSRFEVVVSQAAFKLPQLLTFAAPFLTGEGMLVASKSVDIESELKEAGPAAGAAGLYLSGSSDLTLPVTGDRRRILIYRKA